MDNPSVDTIKLIEEKKSEVKSDEVKGLTLKDAETMLQVIEALCQRTRLSTKELKPLGELIEKLERILGR